MEKLKTLKRFGRELMPHAAWKGIELLWTVVEAVVIASLLALYQLVRSHLDVVSIVAVFVVSLGALVLGAFRRSIQMPNGQQQREPETASLLRLDADTLKRAPRLRVDYVGSGQKGRLVFKSDTATIVRKLGPLLSRERYENEYEFNISPSLPLSVDINSPVECKMYGLRSQKSPDIHSLVDLLRGGTNGSSDSVVIDYDDDHGSSFSRRFDLSRAHDDSIQWIASPLVNLRGQAEFPEPPWQDLAELRQRLVLATAFPREHQAAQQYANELEQERKNAQRLSREVSIWPKAAVIDSMAGQTSRLTSRLKEMLGFAELPGREDFAEILKSPLSNVFPLDSGPLNRKVEKWRFQEDFKDLRTRVQDVPSLDIHNCHIPNDWSSTDVLGLLTRTETALRSYAASLFDFSSSPITS